MLSSHKATDLAAHDLSNRFRRFALQNALPTSPLYSEIGLGIAGDPTALRLAERATNHPVTNLFLAAVHLLLLRGADHPLRDFYPNLGPVAQPTSAVYPEFHSFCRTYGDEIVHILQTRRTQTNEVRRCLYLAPGLDLVVRKAGEIAVIDVGSSAGLHLLWPRFGYDYEGQCLGDIDAPVQLTCRFQGELRPVLPDKWAEPAMQVGIDLNPLDVRNPEDCFWLRALLWPEHRDRAELLESAITLAQRTPPRVLPGNVFDVLPNVLSNLPQGMAVCVCHNHTLNQFSQPDRERFVEILEELSRDRDVYRLSAEWIDRRGINTEHPRFLLNRYLSGRETETLLAFVDDHGRWVQWLNAP